MEHQPVQSVQQSGLSGANPLSPNGGHQEWSNNYMLLDNYSARAAARVDFLDKSITDLYHVYPVPKF